MTLGRCIFNSAATLTVSNSTISGNTAFRSSPSGPFSASGITNDYGSVVLLDCTIANNARPGEFCLTGDSGHFSFAFVGDNLAGASSHGGAAI